MTRIITITNLEEAKRELQNILQELKVVSDELNLVEKENFTLKSFIKTIL